MRERQQKIVEYVQQVGIASYDELAKKFNVSTFTIRRDIDYLAQTRLVAKVKGGAQRIETPTQFREAQLPGRMQLHVTEKEKIALKALEFIRPGDTLFLDGSTTIACLARVLAHSLRNITVVTNSLLVTLELSEAPDIRLIGLGGIFDHETFSFVGFDADIPEDSFHVDKAFFSCAGFVAEHGTFENAAFNRNTKRLMAARADKVLLLIDASKFGKKALTGVLDIKQIDTLITDREMEEGMAETLSEQGVEVVVSDAHPHSQAG